MRRFEMSEGKSHKFWEIDLQGTAFTIRYGRIGTDGRTNTKSFPTEEKAKAEAEKAIRSKTRKGYAEILADVAPSAIAPPNPELEALVINDWENDEVWAVYADWLMAQGDARGEVIRYTIDGDTERAKSIQRVNEEQWLGEFWPIFMKLRKETRGWSSEERQGELSWHRGFVSTVRVGGSYDSDIDLHEMLGPFFTCPAGRMVRSIKIGLPSHDGQADFEGITKWLGEQPPKPSVTRVHLGHFDYPGETEISWTDVGLIDPMLPTFPNLKHLIVQGGNIQTKGLPATLESIGIKTGGLPGGTFGAICASSMPELTTMDIWFGSDNYGAATNPDEIGALLDGKNTPKLKWLGLRNGEIAHELLARLIGSPLLKQLNQLDLSMGTLTDGRAQILIDEADAFQHLQSINVSDNHLSNAFVRRLKSALKRKITSYRQKEIDDDWVYTTVGE